MPSISLTNPANITELEFTSISTQKLGGTIQSLSLFVNLEDLQMTNHELIGSIPDLSNNTALTNLFFSNNQLTGSIPSLSGLTQLKGFYCFQNQLTGSIPSLSGLTQLEDFNCYGNQLTGFDGGSVSITLGFFKAQDNQLTQSAVDAILAAFVAANKTTGTRVLNLGGTNALPTGGESNPDVVTLRDRGWSVTIQ